MQLYKPLDISIPKDRPSSRSQGSSYWQKFDNTQIIDYKLPACSIDSANNSLQRIAIFTPRKIDLYCCKQNKIIQHIASTKQQITSGCLRQDGKLLAVGKTNNISLYELQDRLLLRKFRIKAKTDALSFSLLSNQIYGATTKGIHGFDIAVEQQSYLIQKAHNDIVKRIISGKNQALIHTGSYDGFIKTFDIRNKQAIHIISAGQSVQDFDITGNLVFAAIKGFLQIWDFKKLAGPIINTRLTQKTLSSLKCLQNNKAIIGSTDKHLRVWDWQQNKLNYQSKLQQPILKIQTNKACSHIGICQSNGKVILKSKKKINYQKQEKEQQLNKFHIPQKQYLVKNDKYFKRGNQAKHDDVQFQVIIKKQKTKIKDYDVLLKKFQMTKAITLAASKFDVSSFVAVFQQIQQRGMLQRVAKSINNKQAIVLLKFIKDKIGNPECDLHLSLLVQQMINSGKQIASLKQLNQTLEEEIQLRKDMAGLAGVIQMCLYQ